MSLADIISTLNKGTQSQSPLQDKIDSMVNAKESKLTSFGLNSDADSGPGYRLQNVDAPEVYHDDPASRNKVYMQYAVVNNLDINQAKEEVDAQALAYKTAKDNGYDLGKQIEEARQSGAMDSNFQPTTFDMYRLGDRALEFSDKYQLMNPDKGIFSSNATTQKDDYNRTLVNNDSYANEAIKQGYMVPGAIDKDLYKQQEQLFKEAKLNKSGLYDTDTNRNIMSAIHGSSYTTQENTPQYYTDSEYTSAAGSSLGSLGASVVDAGADFLNATSRNIYKMFNYDMYAGKSETEREQEYTQAAKDILKDTSFSKLFDEDNGRLNFTGVDEAKKKEYWGYKQSEDLTNITTNLKEAWKSGNILEMGKALGSTVLEPEAVGELIAGSTGEMLAGVSLIGTGALITAKANDFMEIRSNITGKPVTGEDIGIATSGALAYGLVNKLTKGNAGFDVIKDSSKSLVNNLNEVGLISMGQFTKDVLTNGAKAYGLEGAEEVVQSIAEEVATKLGTEKANELFGEEMNANLFASFGLGGVAGKYMEMGVDVPRKSLEMYQNNKPLKDVIKTAENLSPEQRDLVLQDLDKTVTSVNSSIATNNQAIDGLNSTLEQFNNDPELDISDALSVLTKNPEIQNEVLNNQINNLNQLTNIEPENKIQVLDFLDSIYMAQRGGTDQVTELGKDTFKLMQMIEGIDENTQPNLIAKDLVSNKSFQSNTDLVLNHLKLNNLISDDVKLSKAVTKQSFTKENIDKFANQLIDMNSKMQSDLGKVNFTKQVYENANTSSVNQTKSEKISDKFNAGTVLDEVNASSFFRGMSNLESKLNEYDTNTLENLQSDLLQNFPKHKYFNKMQSTLTSILRTRNKATKREGFSNGSATDIYNATIAKGADKTSALLRAIRVNKLTPEETTVFKGVVQALRLENEISDVAVSNFMDRINKIGNVEIRPNKSNKPDTKQDTSIQSEPVNTTNTTDTITAETQEVSDSIQRDLTLDGMELVSTDPEAVQQILEATGVLQTMCK